LTGLLSQDQLQSSYSNPSNGSSGSSGSISDELLISLPPVSGEFPGLEGLGEAQLGRLLRDETHRRAYVEALPAFDTARVLVGEVRSANRAAAAAFVLEVSAGGWAQGRLHCTAALDWITVLIYLC
jgi:hypothetical protein